jgi:hypothetical protein
LQAVARLALPDEKIKGCLRWVARASNGVDVIHDLEHKRGGFKGLQTCALRWGDPVCAAKIAQRRRVEVEQGIAAARDRGWSVLLLTFTFSHGPADALRPTLGRFLEAQGDMCRARAYRALMEHYGAVGTIKALECGVGCNGWHPHRHVLLFLDDELSALEVVALEAAVYALWSARAAAVGLGMDRRHGLRVQSTWGAVGDYVAKWGIAAELTQPKSGRGSHLSPFELLVLADETGEAAALTLFREFYSVFKGKNQLVWSRGLRKVLGVGVEASDAEIAAEVQASAVVLAHLDLPEWDAVAYFDDRGEDTRARLQALANDPDPAPVVVFLSDLMRRYMGRPRWSETAGVA